MRAFGASGADASAIVVNLRIMGMTYFRRYRMEMDLSGNPHGRSEFVPHESAVPERGHYEMVAFDEGLLRPHAQAKYHSFRGEMDANVFPCLGRRDGCLKLRREIVDRPGFVAAATWLLQYRERPGVRPLPVGTIQGIEIDGWGAIQNLGVVPEHRGRGLGAWLLRKAANGFKTVGIRQMHLEVTTANVSAIRLYQQIGFRHAGVVYKACDVA